jgi:D-inositol-3-phosphate glycosyltransferase
MRICFVVDFYPPNLGGGEIFASRIAEGFAKSGDQSIVITSRTDFAVPRMEERQNLEILRIGSPRFAGRFLFTLLATPKILSRAKHCDIIHASSYGGAIPAYIAAKILGKKCVYMVYEFMGGLWAELERNWLKSLFYRLTEQLISRLSFDRFVAISRYTRNCLRFMGVADSKLEIVYGGQNPEITKPSSNPEVVKRELGFTSSDFVYAAYGRAGVSKGIEFFVEAIPLILKKVPTAKFLLVLIKGDKRIWDRIQKTLATLPPESYRLLPGMPHDKLKEYLGIVHCVVIPSLSEGFGLAVLEACTLNKRVVATDAGSIPEVIFGEHILVKPGSSLTLAEGCYRAFLGEMDQLPRKEFHWGKTVSEMRRIYQDVLQST